jgi:hypothetical protein
LTSVGRFSLVAGVNQQPCPPIQDEAIQVVLGVNQKHILFPCPGIFQPPFLSQNFSPLPTSPLLPLSPHFPLAPSPQLKRAPKLEQHRALRKRETKGLRKVETSTLKEHEEEKATGVLHSKCKVRKER